MTSMQLRVGAVAAVVVVAGLTGVAPAGAQQNAYQAIVMSAAGDIGSTVTAYRDLLGPDNLGNPAAFAGRREISWDGVPDDRAAPAFLPGDFFAARGAILSTPGQGVQASAKAGNPAGAPPGFGNIHPSYAAIFPQFSPERLFSPVGSNAVDLTFVVPRTAIPAAVNGFGAVYVDVDQPHTAFEYFDAAGLSLGRFAVPAQNEGFSFLGVVFDRPIVARVRIEYGSAALGAPDAAENDVAVMDDFIFGEPKATGLAPSPPRAALPTRY